MLADFEDGLQIAAADAGGDLGDGQRRLLLFKQFYNLQLKSDDGPGRFLARLDSRLMICVDVDERPIKSDRPFIERDQNPD